MQPIIYNKIINIKVTTIKAWNSLFIFLYYSLYIKKFSIYLGLTN